MGTVLRANQQTKAVLETACDLRSPAVFCAVISRVLKDRPNRSGLFDGHDVVLEC